MKSETTLYIDAALALHEINLKETHRAEVEKQFHLLKSMYGLLNAEPISIEVESANTFRL